MKIEMKAVSKSFDRAVLEDFSCEFSGKGISIIMGESGIGKSVLFKLLSGILPPDRGSVIRSANSRLSYLFQENRLLPWLTAYENALAVNRDCAACHRLFADMELLGAEKLYPRQMSGGMQRRVAIVRSILYGGDIFLWDEPFTGLDADLKQRIMKRLKPVLSKKLCLLATHDKEEAVFLADTVYQFTPRGLNIAEIMNN